MSLMHGHYVGHAGESIQIKQWVTMLMHYNNKFPVTCDRTLFLGGKLPTKFGHKIFVAVFFQTCNEKPKVENMFGL